MVFSVMAVDLVHPVSLQVHDEEGWCRDAFSSVWMSMLYFFQTLVAGDSWGSCAVPILQASPSLGCLFGGVFITIQLGFGNLILAMIVDQAGEVHEENREKLQMQREQDKLDAAEKFTSICKEVDKDKNGRLSFNELQHGFDTNDDLRQCLVQLDIEREDLPALFQVMDQDRSGDIGVDEMVQCIHKADTCDIRRQLMFVKLQLQNVQRQLEDHLDKMAASLSAVIGKQQPQLTTMQEELETLLEKTGPTAEAPLHTYNTYNAGLSPNGMGPRECGDAGKINESPFWTYNGSSEDGRPDADHVAKHLLNRA
jgi:Ca2+-binding EF-hand superfamily protein